MKTYYLAVLLNCLVLGGPIALAADEYVTINNGTLQGKVDQSTQVRVFKGIPFAAAPLGKLRWRAPQAAANWQGVREAHAFANQCMQKPIYSDMQFRSAAVSEDCLYLNVWAPVEQSAKKLPVVLYFYGGGFVAGDASEKRYDGASMARHGVLMVSANYRLGIFGLMAHPQLSMESGYGGSGNYSFMDQHAALKWVVANIEAFGGDPKRITIAGESAGSISVSVLMASPLSRASIAGAIGQSGSIIGPTLSTVSLSEAEIQGERVMRLFAGEKTDHPPPNINKLRSIPAEQLLEKTVQAGMQWFMPSVDGYVIPRLPAQMYGDGDFAKVPLLAGVNSQEGSYQQILAGAKPTVEHYRLALKALYPKNFKKVLQLYPATNPQEVMDAAQALASDRFISFSTWNWLDQVSQKSKHGTYYYLYDHVRPLMRAEYRDDPTNQPQLARGAVHSAEIEYALGNLDVSNIYQWDKTDYKVSTLMQQYFVNFIKTGDPNDKTLPKWPLFTSKRQLRITEHPQAEDISYLKARYEFHREYYANKD